MSLQAAKLRLTVNELSGDNVPTASPGSEITELYGYSSTFSLNQIPGATINIPLGGKVEGDNASSVTRIQDWADKLQKRTPVCVVLEVQSEEGMDGLPKGKYCLFKGYLGNINTSYSPKQGSLSVTLHHWLSDLTLIPILNPLSSPENPANIATEACFRATNKLALENESGAEQNPSWTPAAKASDIVKKKTGNIFEAIKTIFGTIASTDYKLTPESAGAVNEELYKKVQQALSQIIGENLDLNPAFNEDSAVLSTAIGCALATQSQSTYYSATIWDKLITTLLPSFNMALVPMVDHAAVIPMPGVFMEDKGEPDITPDHSLQLSVSLARTGMLAGMSLVCRSAMSIEGPGTVPSGHVSCYRYPYEHTKPGVFKVCQLPEWLEAYLDSSPIKALSQKKASTMVFADPSRAVGQADTESDELQQQVEKSYTTYDKLCQAFVKTSYLSEVTRLNSALLIANLDFDRVPGTTLKIQLPSSVGESGENESIFGIITSVGHTISSGSVQATYRLNHIRDSALLNDPDLSNKNGLIFQSGWSALGASLAEIV